MNVEEAKVQIVRALASEFGTGYHSRGLIILVCGVSWLFLEYNLIESEEDESELPPAEVKIHPLTAKISGSTRSVDIEFPEFTELPEAFTSPWKDGKLEPYTIDINSRYGFAVISDILSWISRTRVNGARRFVTKKLASEDPSSNLQQRSKQFRAAREESFPTLGRRNLILHEILSRGDIVQGQTVSGAERQ